MRLSLRGTIVIFLLLGLCGLFVVAQGGGTPAGAAPPAGAITPTRTTGPTWTPIPTALPCGDWRLVPSPNGTTQTNFLQGVAVIAQDDIWVVGWQDYPNQAGLILHWDGSAWAVVPTPAPVAYLHAVAAFGSDDVWAAGFFDGFPARSLILHWDGTAWSVVPTPIIGAGDNFLYGIGGAASDDVWAVGQGSSQALALHWDGTQWTSVPTPALEAGILQAVEAVGPNDVWAVGREGQWWPTDSLALHWDGASWTRVDTPSPGSRENEITSIDAISSNDVWAVGTFSSQIYSYYPLMLHWDGASWEEVPIPLDSERPDNYGSYLEGVTAVSANEVWAVGRDEIPSSDSIAVALRWDGASWTEIQIDQPSLHKNRLWAVDAVQSGEVWAVGTYWLSGPGYGTLTLRYGPECGPGTPGPATRTPTNTPIPPSATRTVTGTPPTATNTPVPVDTVTPAPTACGMLFAEGFEGEALGQFTNIVTQCVGGGCGWIASTTDPHTGARSAFAPDLNNITDQRLQLTTPVLIVAGANLTFWHSYDLENNYDGGVLEASTNGGANWFDMGQHIVSGGYNGTIDPQFENPLAGRDAWTGDSGGYIHTAVNLTPYVNRNLLFRFRQGNDNSLAVDGWHVDDILIAGSTSCPSATVTATSIPGSTDTPEPTNTLTVTPDPTAEACVINFSDVQPGDTFYAPIMCLACHGMINGYADGTFRPHNEVTRGQLAKLVSNAAGYNEDVAHTTQTFADVPVDSSFYMYVERVASRRIIVGYTCGGVGEPCDTNNRPYFRPGANATRGQISKIVSNAAKMSDAPTTQTFADVPSTHTFYMGIERLAMHHMMNGYPCGGPGEPCDANNTPYFRPANNATRGQTSKILANTFYPNCQIPR